jgi:hypothetical protein
VERSEIGGTDDQDINRFMGIWRVNSSMSERAPSLPPNELARRLEPTGMTARDVRAMFHEPEFQAIVDRKSQLLFLDQYLMNECHISINDKRLAEIYQISEGHIRRLRCVARKRQETGARAAGRPRKLTDDREKEVKDWILSATKALNFPFSTSAISIP